MTRINKSKDGRIGPEPKPEPVPAPKTKKKAKKKFTPVMKAKKTRK